MKNILLVEPGYKTKYPPLGLMKISAYHKQNGDRVVFIKGKSPELRAQRWDRIYISTLFTYYWDETIKTINYYKKCVALNTEILAGGVLATLLTNDLKEETGINVIPGLLNRTGILDKGNKTIIDSLTPDYSILDDVNFDYELKNSYIGYATRGCSRKCSFCAVSTIEPIYCNYLPLKKQVRMIEKLYGEKKNLLLLDNNVLASDSFEKIIKDIKTLGFEREAKFSYRSEKTGKIVTVNRYVDFNQGIDARLLDDRKMGLLSEIAIRPLRIAFDDIKMKKIYEKQIRLSAKHGITHLSNYILYNYKDCPDDFYERLRINIELNEELNLRIFSFPMRFIDLKSKNRLVSTSGNLGIHWNKKYLRAIQCVLLRTKGLVGPKKDYFLKAFGNDLNEFYKILIMPEDYIINRFAHEKDGSTYQWWKDYTALNTKEIESFNNIIYNHYFKNIDITDLSKKLQNVISHYIK